MRLIEVLGPGCQRCQFTEKLVREVVDSTGVEAEIRHVNDYAEIAQRGVMSTPAIAIDGTIVSMGRVPTRAQIASWLGAA